MVQKLQRSMAGVGKAHRGKSDGQKTRPGAPAANVAVCGLAVIQALLTAKKGPTLIPTVTPPLLPPEHQTAILGI